MLKRIRIILAFFCFTAITLMFLDFTGTLHNYFEWLAHIQLLPAVMAGNIVVVAVVLLLTLLFGRWYCSILCPMGVMQDLFYKPGLRHRNKKKVRQSAEGTKPMNKLRIAVLAVFVILLVAGVNAVALLIAPYSAYGRIASNLFQPVYLWVNNLLAGVAEHYGSYAFYSADVWLKSGLTLAVAAVTFAVVGFLAWRGGRTWCNTICPVGTVLGFVSKYALFKPVIDNNKCLSCGKCAKACKASCINAKEKQIDYSRCVGCMDCIGDCKQGAVSYQFVGLGKKAAKEVATDTTRRQMIIAGAAVAASSAVMAQEKEIDGGLAAIEDKKIPTRKTPIKPAGSTSVKSFTNHCTACQLCVSACPNGVLRPSGDFGTFMQPEMSYERGYCRPECTACADVCPAGAIKHIAKEEKVRYKIGLALYVADNCVVNRDNVKCDSCFRHCPTGAIVMVPKTAGEDPDLPMTLKVPTIDETRCIGCGACENLCPARPFSAIYVEGREDHLV